MSMLNTTNPYEPLIYDSGCLDIKVLYRISAITWTIAENINKEQHTCMVVPVQSVQKSKELLPLNSTRTNTA